VQRDLARIGQDEVPVRQQAEVGGDLVVADPGDPFGDQFLFGHFTFFVKAVVQRGAEPQAL
jgi:hypothetical protein